MGSRGVDVEGLLGLPLLRERQERGAAFRSSITGIARAAEAPGASPLDGTPSGPLTRAIRVALDAGFFEELDWLSPDAAGVALFEIGAALPPGPEKREVGRRVLARLRDGNAKTFVAIACRMARGVRKSIGDSIVRPRVRLALAAPTTLVDAGPLAFAIATRRELAREWIVQPSTGALDARQLAAKLISRAAAHAARRALAGDEFAARVLSSPLVQPAYTRLLADREPLVWRHAAVARGVLAGVHGGHWRATIEALHPRHTPTEWRRGAVSLVAAIGSDPKRALARVREVIAGGLPSHDAGLLGAMPWGLGFPLEVEPEAAEALLDELVVRDPKGTAEGLAALVRDVDPDDDRMRAIASARERLSDWIALEGPSSLAAGDEVDVAVAATVRAEALGTGSSEPTLRSEINAAIRAWCESGTREASVVAQRALAQARSTIGALEAIGGADSRAEISAEVSLLRELDAGLLEDDALEALLRLPRRASADGARTPEAIARATSDEEHDAGPIDELIDRLSRWLLAREVVSPTDRSASISLSARRLRAILHLVDAEVDGPDDRDDSARSSRARARRSAATQTLLDRLVRSPHPSLQRTLCAALARALDARVRDGSCEPVDVMLLTASVLPEARDVRTLAEASMDPDVEAALSAWAQFVDPQEETSRIGYRDRAPAPTSSRGISLSPIEEGAAGPLDPAIDALVDLAAALGDDGSGRGEAVRAVLVRLSRALRAIGGCRGRDELAAHAPIAIDAIATSAQALFQLTTGARQRVLAEDDAPPASVIASLQGRLAVVIARALEPGAIGLEALGEVLGELRRLAPSAIVGLTAEVLKHARSLPDESQIGSAQSSARSAPMTSDALPAWLGPRRTIGAFWVERTLGNGGNASVFVAKRAEERHEDGAERFALKVPDYDGAAARSLSEQQFLDIFRAEATALIALPPALNIARFVSFDLAARPKPILVMELIEGPTLERYLDTARARASGGPSSVMAGAPSRDEGAPTIAAMLDFLDGIAAGLEGMHLHAVGHLDLKPGNVVLRDGRTPTLVDFGLSGRQIRPGCATCSYGAPEIWGALPDDFSGQPSPCPADVYAFGALFFELLTGETLFDAESELMIIGRHLAHDGRPPPIERIAHVRPVAELLACTLRRDPRDRWPISKVRAGIRAIRPVISELPWPLA